MVYKISLSSSSRPRRYSLANCGSKRIFNFSLSKSTIKASNSFVTAKESKPLLYNITEPTSTICRADNYDGSKAIKKLKTFHNSNKIIVDQKNKESD